MHVSKSQACNFIEARCRARNSAPPLQLYRFTMLYIEAQFALDASLCVEFHAVRNSIVSRYFVISLRGFPSRSKYVWRFWKISVVGDFVLRYFHWALREVKPTRVYTTPRGFVKLPVCEIASVFVRFYAFRYILVHIYISQHRAREGSSLNCKSEPSWTSDVAASNLFAGERERT